MCFPECYSGGERRPRTRTGLRKYLLSEPDFSRHGIPSEFLREHLEGRIGVDHGFDTPARTGVAHVGERTQEDVKSCGSFLDGSFGEARNLEEAARGCRIASGVEFGRRFGLVGSDDRVGVKRGAGADVNFNVMKSALGFHNAVPAE